MKEKSQRINKNICGKRELIKEILFLIENILILL